MLVCYIIRLVYFSHIALAHLCMLVCYIIRICYSDLSSSIYGPPNRIFEEEVNRINSLSLREPGYPRFGLVSDPHIIQSTHIAYIVMAELTRLRRRRGIVRSSITRLEKRLREFEELSEQPASIHYVRELTDKLLYQLPGQRSSCRTVQVSISM